MRQIKSYKNHKAFFLGSIFAATLFLSNALALKPSDPEWKTAVLTFDDAKAAADLGDAYGQAVVSIYYFFGWQTDNNPEDACRYAQKSADQKNPLGAYMLGASYRSGSVVAYQNEGIALQKKAVPGLQKMLENPYAIEALGELAVEGKVVPSDPKKGVLLHKKAADMGHALAQQQYALCARDGVGMEKNSQICLEYVEKAVGNKYSLRKEDSKKDNPEIGSANNKTVDVSESFKRFLEQAEQGNPEAQYTVSVAYAQGVGVAVDINESYRWLCKAAKQYQPNALTLLGVMYFTGKADKQDSGKAFQLIHEAAEQGSTTAASLLGSMYSNGIGVNKDLAQADLWMKKSDKQGQSEAGVLLKHILDYIREHHSDAVANKGNQLNKKDDGETVKQITPPQLISNQTHTYTKLGPTIKGLSLGMPFNEAIKVLKMGIRGSPYKVYLDGPHEFIETGWPETVANIGTYIRNKPVTSYASVKIAMGNPEEDSQWWAGICAGKDNEVVAFMLHGFLITHFLGVDPNISGYQFVQDFIDSYKIPFLKEEGMKKGEENMLYYISDEGYSVEIIRFNTVILKIMPPRGDREN